jgi:hypothetical protein
MKNSKVGRGYLYLSCMSLLMCIIGSMAQAQIQNQNITDVQLGIPSYGGNGCPAGTASANLSPDSKELSILFDQYVAEAGKQVGRSFDRKACNLSIPIKVPNGYSLSVYKVDYRGFNDLPRGASSTFSVEYFFAGRSGPRYSKSFYGQISSDYLLSNEIVASALVWSECGAEVNLRTNASMFVRTNTNGDQAMSTVDSMDVSSGLIYHVQLRRCGSSNDNSSGGYLPPYRY